MLRATKCTMVSLLNLQNTVLGSELGPGHSFNINPMSDSSLSRWFQGNLVSSFCMMNLYKQELIEIMCSCLSFIFNRGPVFQIHWI